MVWRDHKNSQTQHAASARFLIGPVVLLLLALTACAKAAESAALSNPSPSSPSMAPSPAPSYSVSLPPSATSKPLPKPTKAKPTTPKPAPPTTTKPPASNCDPSYPDVCLHDGIGDYDCAGGTGNGPNYVTGPVRVVGSDPFGLDGNNDGWGCTS
jgi:hypothetical protein